MPIYESNGKRYSIPEDKVNDFLKAREGAKLVDETPFYLSKEQPKGSTVKQPEQQPNVAVQEEPKESTIDVSNLFSKHVARDNAFDNVKGGVSLRDTAKVGHLGRSNNQGIPDAMKDTYQDYKSGEQFKSSIQDQLEAFKTDNQSKLQDRYHHLQAREQEYERTKSGFQKLATAGSARTSDRALIQLDEDYSNYKFASDYINEAQQLISNVQDEKGILKGVSDAIFDYDTWILGIESTRKNAYTNAAIQKLERGEELTESENALLDAMALNLAASAYYGSDLKRQYNWGQIAGESLPFMMEFILNPFAQMGKGVGKAIARHGLKRFGKKGIGGAATRVGGSLASDIVGASAMVGTTGLPRVGGDAMQRLSGDAYYDVDEEGKIIFGGTEGAVDPLEAITDAFLSQGIEYFSEMTGERFSEVGRLIGRSPALKGIKATGFGRAMTKFNRSPVVRELRGLEKRGQWSGLIGEWYEERVGTMLNSLLVGDEKWSDLYDLEQQVDTFMGLSLTGGLMGGIRTTGYAADRAQSANKLRRTDRNASSHFPNWDNMKSQIEGMTLAERKASILDIALSKDIPSPAKAAYTDYVGAKNYQDVLSGIKEESNQEELIDTQQRINQLVNTAVNPQTNSIIIANVPGMKEVRIYGDIILNEDGTINEKDSGSVFYTGEDGKRHVVSPKFVEIVENTPADQAKEETLNIVTEEITNRQANEAVRPYESGEVITFSPDGANSMLGQITGRNEDGTYQVAVDGMPAPAVIEPRMIVPEDNIRGIENGMQVQYRDQAGNIQTGIVNDAYGLRMQGLIDVDGNMVPTTDIIPIDEMVENVPENEDTSPVGDNNLQPEVEETEQNDISPEQQEQIQAEQEKQAFMDSLPVFDKGKNQGEIDQSRMTPEQNVQYFEYTYGKEKALQAAEKQVANLKKRLKSEQTKLDNDPFNIQQNQKVEDVQTQLDAYSNYVNQEKQRLTEENIKSTPKSSIVEDRQARSEDIRQEEAGATGQADQSIIEKWSNAEKIEGIEDVITLSNGEKIEGRYVLTTADAPSPSHDIERNFAKTVGFPVNEQGNTVNDRDYEADLTAQTLVQQRANNYDERAVQTPVVVSQDGVVLSGNDRTMAGQIAAINGTDGAYTSYIERYANRWGFTPEQVQSVQNPRIVFVPNNPMPYNTATFAKFNAEEKKTQNSLESAIKASKSISREVIIPLSETIENFDKLTDFYSSAPAIKKTINALLNNGVIQPNELPRLMDGNLLSSEGKSFLETIMLGSVLGEQALREVDQMRSVRQTLMRTMPQLFRNSSLKEYSLMNELNNAIHLLYEAKQNGSAINLHLKQRNLFELSAEEVYSETEKMLSLMLEGEKDITFRNIFEAFNKKAVSIESGQVDLFDGIVEKPDLLKQILEIYGQQETESSEQAKSPHGVDSRSEERREEQRPEEQSTDGTGQQREVDPQDTNTEKLPSEFDLTEHVGKTLYHGSPEGKLTVIDPSRHSRNWREGIGFYTTESKEKAQKYANGRTARGERKNQQGAVLSLTIPNARILDMDARVDRELWSNVAEAIDIPLPELSGTNMDGYNSLIESYNEDGSNEGQYAVEEALSVIGYDGSTHMEGVNSTPHRVFIWKNEFNLPIQQEAERREPIDIVAHAKNVAKNEEIRVEADKTDTKPSEAQKEAGNYRKGHINIQGFDITIENPAGSVRSGVNQDGTEWSNTMQNHYGYFKRTNGKDGDQIDVFIGDKPESNHIFVVDQINPETKEFDESKVMLGFDTLQEAQDAYLSNYEEGWQGLGSITTVDVDTFKEWAKDRKSQRKPFREYRDVQSKQVPKEYGADNKVVTTDQYEELKQRMRGLLNNLNVGFNPEIFTIGAQMAAYHLEAGSRKFADYATRMINDLGENVKPYLKSFYEGVRAMGNEYEGMDSYKYVKDFDVNSIGKEVQQGVPVTSEKRIEAEKPSESTRYTNTNNSVSDYPQQAIIQSGKIKVNNKYGRKTINSFEISLSEWEGTLRGPSANPSYNKRELVKQKHIKAFPGNLKDGVLTNIAERVIDAEVSAINGAYEKYKAAQQKTEENQTDNQKDDVSLRKEPQQGSLFDNANTEEDGSRQQTDTRADNRQSESDRGRLPESEQVPEQGVSSEDASRTGEGERMLTESSSDQPRTRHEHDVNKKYSNEEIHDIVSSVTEIKDGKVEITGEITDDIKTIAGRYKSGGVAKEGRGVLDEYYTSERIVDAVGEILSKYIKPNTNTRALEPSVGIGNFIDALPNKGEIISFEINETTARIAKILHPNIEVNLRPFETEFIDEKGNKKPMPSKYDIVVGNPPYGQHRGKYKGLGEESRISRYEDYFVKRGLDVLNENGILAMVLPSGWMNRNKLENGYRILDAYRLPTGVFEGTDIGTDIVVLQKDSKHKSKENHNYFDNNPANILGEIKERKNRFGRMEEYVDGDIDSAMDALRQSEAKKIASDLHIEPTKDNVNEIDEAVKEATTSDGAKKVVRATREKKSPKPATKGGKINITPSQLKYEFKRGDEVVPAANQFPNKFSKEETEAFRDTDYSGVFKNPEKHQKYANYYAGKWMHDFYYAEGNIYDRLEQLERDKGNISKEQYDKQRQMLQDVLPDQKALDEINMNPNTAFVKNLNLPSSESEKTSLQDRFLEFIQKLPRDAFGSSNYWEVRSYVHNEQVYGQDKGRNQLVRDRRKRVGKDLFDKFLNEELTDTQRKQVEYAFNREYNAVYRPDYAKVPMFSNIHKNFRGKPFELTEVQKAGIGRMTVKGVGVLAHEVGFGKTLSAILSMHEAMERGYTKRPLIVVPNDSILQQWVETINDIIPEATVNVLGNLGVKYNLDNFNVNDGEYTIVTYQGFKKLSFENDVYDKLAQDFHYISDTDLDKQKSTRESEKGKADIEETVGKMQRQGSYSFEDAGFDYLTFDEVHNANHIVGKVQIDRKDHSDFRSQSQNTSDLGIKTWVAAQYIQQQNDGRNVLLLSATPFTNKPLEYYSILSLVANSTLKRMGFYQVDQFFETFMEADNDLEIAANGKAQQKTNVRRFRNNGLFNQLLGEYIDIKGEQDNPDLIRPERLNKEYKIPQNNLTQDALARAQELLEDGETVLSGLTQSRLIAFSPYASYLSNESPQSYKEFVENSPKIHGTIKLIEQNRKDNPGAGQIVYSELGVDFFPYIRDYLINESKFKASEVAIIAGSTSATERARIQSEFNKGTIKVILGSPAIKEGMNLQENTTDMYILSLPYNFTQLRQVEGRGWRQGNTWRNIRINYMLTNDSVDVFMLQRLQIKQGLYNEAMRQGAETIDVSDINTEELKNALITNPETRANLELTVEKNRLEAEKERINADLAFILRKHEKFNELRSTVDQKRERVRNLEKNAEKDSWWIGYVEREKKNLLEAEGDLQEEKLNIEKKGVNVDDIDNQIEKSNAQIQALDNEIEGLKGEYTNLVDKYRKEREELSKESGNLLERHLQERAKENKGGFYEKRDNILFRSNDSREAYAEREWNRAKNRANEIASRLGVEIDILETTDGLTGKKAEAKGWYEPKTGKIVIVMPNHRSSGDVQATILHETVGHHGLRELFGEHFDTFLDNVFNNADEGIQRTIRNIEKEQGLDRRTATEEYLSWLAEDGSILEGHGMQSWFGKVKQFFLDMLAKVGINLDFRLSDNELRYILWRSYQNLANPGRYKKPSDQASDSAMQSELKVGSFAEIEHIESEVADPRFRMTQPPHNVSEAAAAANSSMTEQLRQEYDKKYSRFATRFREAWEDMYLPVKQFLDVLRENGIEVAEYNDFYKQATALSGKNDAQLDHFRKAFQKPITEQISNLEKLGFEYRDIENYVFAKHGLERNDYMAKQQAKEQFKKERDSAVTLYEKGAINDEAYESRIDDINQRENDRYLYLLETKDYAGLTALTDELQQSAEDYIIEFEDKAGKEATDGLWDAIKKATDYTLDRQYKSGMIKKETLDELRSRYDNYVPLRGHDETTAEDRWDYTPDMGTYFSAPLLKAHGRRSRAESPFAYIEQMAHSAITWGNKNDLKQTMLRLARTDTKGLMSASQTWYRNMGTKEDPRWEQVSAEYSENVDQYLQNQRDFEEQMQELHAEGMAFQSGARKLDIGGIFIKPKQAEQHELRVYQNGTSYTVYINANPAVAQAINGSNRKDISKSLGAFSTVTRNMAANFTTRNPLFVLTNFSRDYIFASSILMAKESPAYAVKFQRNIPNAMGSLQRYVRGKLDMTNPNDVMMYEYIMNGAKTGFSSIFELDRVAKKLKREAEKGNKKKSALDYGRNVLDVVDSLNEIAENMSRLSVYITSRKEGRSITQSVHDAKNVTVNFNQKGAGTSAAKNGFEAFIFNAAGYVRPLFLFSNAAIQSLSNFSKVAIKNPKGMSALVASYALSGFIAPFLAGLIGGDDGKEDYMKLSDWERQNNWCIWLPNGFVKIPLPHELRVFHRMGDNIYQAAFENRDIFQTLLDVAMGFSDLLPVNPLGSTDASWAELVPDAIRPFVQLETNTNFMGSRIYDEWASEHAPGYQKVRTNKKGEPYAPKALIGISKWIDNTTGGDGVKKGVISPPNPDIVHHLMRGYFGGLYTLSEQGINIVAQAYNWTQTGDLELKVRQTPLRTFYADANDLNIQGSGLNSRYWKVTDDILERRRRIKGYSDQLVNGEITHDVFQEKIKGLNVPLVNEINEYIKTIRKYENALKEMNSDEQKEAERIISDLKKTVIELGNGI